MKNKPLVCCVAALSLLAVPAALAQTTLAQWTFESVVSTLSYLPGAGVVTTNFYAEAGAQAGAAAVVGWHAGASTYSSPAGHPGRSLSSTTWTNVGDYYQATVSTLGYQGIVVSFDQYSSGTGPGNFYLAYSTDGVNFTQFGSIYTVLNATWASYTNDLSSVSAINNQSTVYFRLVCANNVSANSGIVAAGGTDRIDNFTVTGSAPGAPTVSPASQTNNIYYGDSTTLAVSSGGNEPLTYQWYYPNLSTPLTDGGNISGSASQSLSLAYTSTNQAGIYYVVITNSLGSVTGQVTLNISVRAPIVTNIAYLRTLVNPTTFAPTDTTNLYTVQGIVTSHANTTGSTNLQFYMQNGASGIMVFIGGGQPLLPSAGDRVQVTGPLGQFYGQLEFNMSALNPAQSFTNISSGNPLPAPAVFDFANQANVAYMKSIESSLVAVFNVYPNNTNAYYVSGSTVTLTNLSGLTFPQYVNPYVSSVIASPVPAFASSITGLMAQHASGSVYTNGFQLLVTQYSDIVAGTPPVGPASITISTVSASGSNVTLTWTPNPAGSYSYSVWRTTALGGAWTPLQSGISGTSYTDTSATTGAGFYRVSSP